MAALIHQEIAYSYKRYTAIIALPNDDDARTLASIESLLVDAANAYRQRRYLDAIDAYNSARGLLWSQIQPTVFYDDVKFRDVNLVKTFVSLGSEWLNVLPVEQPVAGVRPREQVALETGPLLGLRSAALNADAVGAVADMHLADTLERRGNTGAAEFFKTRAESLAPDLMASIELANQPVRDRDGPIDVAFEAHRVSIENAVVARLDRPIGLAAALNAIDVAPAVVTIPPKLTVDERSYAFRSNGDVKTLTWAAGAVADTDGLLGNVYEARKTLTRLPDILIAPERPADVAVALAHAWHYESPLGLAECYHALGDWVSAEQWYLSAAKYEYLNGAVEAPYVWGRLATLYLDWGDSLFRDDDAQGARLIYERVLMIDGSEPAADLYTIPGLAPGAVAARDVIAHLDDAAKITATPTIASVVLDIWAQLSKIAGGLDFWGHWAANVPIWTFDYLQSVAITFCQLAIGAERDAMTFWEKADLGQLTRTQLVQNVAQTKAERSAAQRQVEASHIEADAFAAAEQTAALRAANARDNAEEYEQKSWDWTLHQAQSAQLAGGSDGNASELNRLADRMMNGPYSISGERGTLGAAEQLAASRIQREYEIDTLKRQAEELASARVQARAERDAAEARVRASQASLDAANVRVEGAMELVAAFDQQRFTPDVWHALGEKMSALSNRYLVMALDVSKRMQRAYNFENDVALSMIKADYSSDSVRGLLAADTLHADVQTFTYDLIMSTAPKPQPIQQTISLAERYPFLFETQFRPHGRMEFQTTLDDFDERYPGTYAGRITHVDVQVDGIVPPRGLSGTLTNAGISQYRMPADASAAAGSGIKHRVQSRESLVLSDYDARTDALLVDDDRRRLRVFEGAGVASTWTLALPKEVNDLDYDAITDVRLTFTYEGRFDPDLRDKVIAELATRPQANERQRPLPLRWLYPDAFFAFYETGALEITLEAIDFPATQTKPKIAGLSLIAVTTPRARADGIVLRVKVPGHAAITVTTGTDGTVPADDLAAVIGENVLGDWKIELRESDNPSWVTNGALVLDEIDNLSLVLGYSFTPRS